MSQPPPPQPLADPPYFLEPAAAFVRASAPDGAGVALPERLARPPLAAIGDDERAEIVRLGREAGLRLHRYKRTMGLPRVRRVLGVLAALQLDSLLDVGSGRGAFLWPLLDAFPSLPVTAIDRLPLRAEQLRAVRRGGVDRLAADLMDATALKFGDRSFDGVTLLEVLEHIPAAPRALSEAVRVARRFVILSVPAKADDNPEHIHLFDRESLAKLFAAAGVSRVRFEHVPNHLIAVANIAAAGTVDAAVTAGKVAAGSVADAAATTAKADIANVTER